MILDKIDATSIHQDDDGTRPGTLSVINSSFLPTSMPPLHVASIHGHASNIQLLLEKGANVHLRESVSGHTALFHAARNGHVQCVELLKAAGAHFSRSVCTEEHQTSHDLSLTDRYRSSKTDHAMLRCSRQSGPATTLRLLPGKRQALMLLKRCNGYHLLDLVYPTATEPKNHPSPRNP